MSVTHRILDCGCYVYEEDGAGPWPVGKREVLGSVRSELCGWAWEKTVQMVDTYFAADEMTPKALKLQEDLLAHGGIA